MPSTNVTEVRVAFATLLKVAAFVLLVVCVVKLWPVIIMVFVATLIAAVLDPFVDWLQRHRVRRSFAIAVVSMLMFGIVAAFVFVVLPAMTSELTQLIKDFPQIAKRFGASFPRIAPLLNSWAARVRQPPSAQQMQGYLIKGAGAGVYALEGVTTAILVLVLAIYLLIEGSRAVEWLLSFAPRQQRPRWRKLVQEGDGVLVAYMRGQAITCCLCGGVAFTTLTLLHVPGAVPLAVLAFIADLVPVVGTIAMTVPAVMLALVAGPVKAVIVVVVYLTYHLVESYVIIPRVYGGQMKLSTLTVLLAVTVGGVLQGAIGAVLLLPVVALYPIVERTFLRESLPEDTVERHEAIEESGT
jgi:predicted PurR-regulated permease PerM